MSERLRQSTPLAAIICSGCGEAVDTRWIKSFLIETSSLQATRESRGLAPQLSALVGLLGSIYRFSGGAGSDSDPPDLRDDTTRGE